MIELGDDIQRNGIFSSQVILGNPLNAWYAQKTLAASLFLHVIYLRNKPKVSTTNRKHSTHCGLHTAER